MCFFKGDAIANLDALKLTNLTRLKSAHLTTKHGIAKGMHIPHQYPYVANLQLYLSPFLTLSFMRGPGI